MESNLPATEAPYHAPEAPARAAHPLSRFRDANRAGRRDHRFPAVALRCAPCAAEPGARTPGLLRRDRRAFMSRPSQPRAWRWQLLAAMLNLHAPFLGMLSLLLHRHVHQRVRAGLDGRRRGARFLPWAAPRKDRRGDRIGGRRSRLWAVGAVLVCRADRHHHESWNVDAERDQTGDRGRALPPSSDSSRRR